MSAHREFLICAGVVSASPQRWRSLPPWYRPSVQPTVAAASSTPGVTAKTITVGIPYVDIAYVDKTFGLKLNQGSYPDAYTALFDQLNAHGGIDGRKSCRIRRCEPHRDGCR